MGIRVVLIDDNPADSYLLKEALSQAAPCECLAINHGDQALEYLRELAARPEGQPDLIVLDLNLPGRSGVELLEFIRTTEGITEIPVAVLSSHPKQMQQKEAAFANCFLQKPSSLDAFMALGSELLRQIETGLNSEGRG